jgi:hypothetical protein
LFRYCPILLASFRQNKVNSAKLLDDEQEHEWQLVLIDSILRGYKAAHQFSRLHSA